MKIEEILSDKGYVRLVIESEDDLWILSMLINEEDLVSMKTTRDVSINGSEKRRLPMKLVIRVKHVEFQPFTGRLRIRGVIEEGPEEYGLKGSYHTFSVDIGSRVEILKREGVLNRDLFDKLIEVANKGRRALLVALDYDSYCIALLQGQGLRILSEGSIPSPSKSSHESYREFESYLQKIAREIESFVKTFRPIALVVGSPGDLAERLVSNIRETELKIHRDNVSLGGCEGVDELIRRGVVRKILRDYSEIRGEEILEEYMRLLIKDPERTLSGLEKLHQVSSMSAIEKLVLIDSLLRSDESTRRIALETIYNVFSRNGDIVIVSSESPLGLKLRSLGGAIGILRFRVYLDEEKRVF
ncbi:MAG: hypothetical protein ABWJ42_02425 [Sulfolobales archaeon]